MLWKVIEKSFHSFEKWRRFFEIFSKRSLENLGTSRSGRGEATWKESGGPFTRDVGPYGRPRCNRTIQNKNGPYQSEYSPTKRPKFPPTSPPPRKSQTDWHPIEFFRFAVFTGPLRLWIWFFEFRGIFVERFSNLFAKWTKATAAASPSWLQNSPSLSSRSASPWYWFARFTLSTGVASLSSDPKLRELSEHSLF